MSIPITTVLVTGASVGLGEECARQLALIPTITRIILGCRNDERARAAKERLETKSARHIFEILIIDLSKPDSVKHAVEELQGPINGMVLNAGGKGGMDHAAITEFGVPSIVAANLAGHVLLVDLLLQQEKLHSTATVIYSGSEAARGSPLFGIPKPVIKDGSVEEFTSICDGSFYSKDSSFEAMYSRTKLVATFWMAFMARQQKSMRFVTISPGATAGTDFLNDFPASTKWFISKLIPVLKFLGAMHSVETGAKRYVDALIDDGSYKSGNFYGSKSGGTGIVVDQVEFMPALPNEMFQENVNTAIHKFVQKTSK